MNGECWLLAYYLHKLGGWPVAWVAPTRESHMWEHVYVKVDGRMFDVRGFGSLAETGYQLGPKMYSEFMAPGGPWRSLRKYSMDIAETDDPGVLSFVADLEVGKGWARVMAKRLVVKYEL